MSNLNQCNIVMVKTKNWRSEVCHATSHIDANVLPEVSHACRLSTSTIDPNILKSFAHVCFKHPL